MEKKQLKLLWSHDEHDCETCDSSYDTGLEVWLDGIKIMDDPAGAHCLNQSRYYEDNLMMLINILGYTTEEDWKDDDEDT